jgi:hypothetical protein
MERAGKKIISGRTLIGTQDCIFQGEKTAKEGYRFPHFNLP